MKKYLFVSAFLFSLNVHSQNLVINSGFEDTLQCPYFVSQIDFATNWHTSVNTPDYYNGCNNTGAINPGMVGVPNSARGYQPARNGNAFAGVVIYWTAQADYREIFYAQLLTPLSAGVVYDVGMYVVLDEDNAMWAVDGGLGIYLSSSVINPLTPFAYTPQIANPPGNVLNDSLNWTSISGKYTATGGEQYITIGSFIPDNMLTIINRGGTYPFTSYAIEDVWVIPDSMTSGVKESSLAYEIKIAPNPSNGNFTIEFNSEKSCKAKIELVNLFGETRSTENIVLNKGKNSILLNDQNLSAGIYFLKIISENYFVTEKIIITE